MHLPLSDLCIGCSIKSEPDIHQSVKSSEDSMLRRRLTQTAPIPEDERTQVCCYEYIVHCSRCREVLILSGPGP